MSHRRVFGLVILCGLLPGCQPEQRVVRDTWSDFANDWKAGGGGVYTGQRGGDGGGADATRPRPSTYAVWLGDFEGDDRMQDAYQAASWLRGQAGVPDVWLSEADARTSVYAGRFRKPDSRDARHLLGRVQKLKHGDDKPYASAKLVPILDNNQTPASPLDLRGYRSYYTLQVGFFDQAYPGDRRDAAETWARQLRAEDDVEAFYYHGPNRSMVTVGLFTRADFVRKGNADAYGPRILALQKRYPHNLGNGMTLIEKSSGGRVIGEQESSLVRVP